MTARPSTRTRRLAGIAADAGFTLMELMIVMTLIVTLAGVGLSMYGNSVTRSKEAVLKEDLFRLRDAIDRYYADKNKYPPTLESLVADKYIRAIPVDPFTASADTWQTTMSELEAGNVATEPGIFDVKSGSELSGLDGTPYANW